MGNPLYDELAEKHGLDIPENPGWFSPATTRSPPSTELVDVPPRVDDWCEDRPPHELTDDDGIG